MELKSESTPRVLHTRRTIVFHPIKISGLSVEATIRWLRTLPESFRDSPAPRVRAAVAGRPPYQHPRFWLPRITRSASARWWVVDAAFRRASRVTKSRTHQCQRSIASPFYGQDEIIIPNHLGENKGKFEIEGFLRPSGWAVDRAPVGKRHNLRQLALRR